MILREQFNGPVTFGDGVTVHGLGVIPLMAEAPSNLSPIVLIDEAITAGFLTVTETSEAGDVPFLKVENTGETPVLILEGEELVGGKQNRIVNASILIPSGTVAKIPVSCMEAGRWHSRSSEFTSGEAIFRAKSRAVQKESVSRNLMSEGSFRSDQHAVWDEVSDTLHEFETASPTSDFRAGRENVAHRIEEFVQRIHARENQIGAVFLAENQVLGCELLGSPNLFASALEKVVRSFAMDVLRAPDLQTLPVQKAEQWWQQVLEASLTSRESPGTGQDVRMSEPHSIGSGLVWNGSMVHFSCFPKEDSTGDDRRRSRRAPASERQRRMRNR